MPSSTCALEEYVILSDDVHPETIGGGEGGGGEGGGGVGGGSGGGGEGGGGEGGGDAKSMRCWPFCDPKHVQLSYVACASKSPH